jgi:dipeptidyl-peptidase-3
MTEKLENGTFQYQAEEFADIRILRYNIPGFEQLSERKKLLLYYLYKASLSGRDIIWDQNCKYNLYVRNVLEHIYRNREKIPPYLFKRREEWDEFVVFLKQIWVHNGIHHNISSEKLVPKFSRTWLRMVIELGTGFPKDSVVFRYKNPQEVEGRYTDIYEILFNDQIVPTRVCKEEKVDKVQNSAANFYENITQKEAEEYYKQKVFENKDDPRPIPYGLNTKLIKKKDSKIVPLWVSERNQLRTAFSDEKSTDPEELIQEISFSKIYSRPISHIYHWLSLAIVTTESREQRESLTLLADYLVSGDLQSYNKYCIAWLKDDDYDVDIIGPAFIETYGDPLDHKGGFESVVTIRDSNASKRMELLCENAQWFEDHSPVFKKHKKKEAKGINARVVNVVVESGDASPMTVIGVNLPNSDWIRKEHGSKSINMDNIINAYDNTDKNSGMLEEFYYDNETIDRIKKYGDHTYKIFVDLHEVLGHGSGQLEEGVSEDSLKEYARVIEEVYNRWFSNSTDKYRAWKRSSTNTYEEPPYDLQMVSL